MTESKLEERKERAKKMMSVLKKLYPSAETELNWNTHFELLVAVILAVRGMLTG